MESAALAQWFAANHSLLEEAYTAMSLPWQQSGFGIHTPRTAVDWAAARRPIADCIDHSGSFLDIGCANGYLLECLLRWAALSDFALDPHGLDISDKLLALAQKRLPQYADQMYLGNAWDWTPPRRFDYVRTELVYVPEHLHHNYVTRLLDQAVTPGGALLITEYASSRDRRDPTLHIDSDLAAMGVPVEGIATGYLQGVEVIRVAIVRNSADAGEDAGG